MRNDEIDEFKDINQSYYIKHKKKFDNFSDCVMWKNNRLFVNKISVPSLITYHQKRMRLTITREKTAFDYLNNYNQGCMINEVDKIVKIFISDLKDITFWHYMGQTKSMLCRKLVGNFVEENFGDFENSFLPNCFRHINTYLFSI